MLHVFAHCIEVNCNTVDTVTVSTKYDTSQMSVNFLKPHFYDSRPSASEHSFLRDKNSKINFEKFQEKCVSASKLGKAAIASHFRGTFLKTLIANVGTMF